MDVDPPHPDLPHRAQSMQVPKAEPVEDTTEADTSLPIEVLRHSGTQTEIQAALRRVAATNDMEGVDWPALKDLMKSRIDEHLATFQTSESSLYDKALEPPWILSDEEVANMKAKVFSQLDGFQSSPPFTVQRLSELALSPIPHYSNSLPKYVRALMRCLFVTSPYSAFDSTESILPHANGFSSLEGPLGRRSRSSSISSTSSRSSQHMALLSPIPWIKKDPTPEPEGLSLDDAQPLPDAAHPHVSPERHATTDLPSGRVDELDPGPEARDASKDGNKDPAAMMDEPVELGLNSRFVSKGTEDTVMQES